MTSRRDLSGEHSAAALILHFKESAVDYRQVRRASEMPATGQYTTSCRRQAAVPIAGLTAITLARGLDFAFRHQLIDQLLLVQRVESELLDLL